MTKRIDGVWYSSNGSKLELEVKNFTELTGKFHNAQYPNEPIPIHGSIESNQYNTQDNTQDNTDCIPVFFSASWPTSHGHSPSVVSYTGQYTKEGNKEQVEVTFLVANQVEGVTLWQSTSIASDVFTRKATMVEV